MELSKEAKRNTIADLRKYPDWIVRIECDGLGGQPVALGGFWESDFSTQGKNWRKSIIEDSAVYDEEVRRKIFAIERVFERLQGDMKNIIRLRYLLPGNEPEDIQSKLGISKATYFRLQYSALISFSRALGHIK